ncbi:MAG: hypothetical protein KJ559_00300 [Nanoarchaeota archaeon]|nr:hypothetical protein [Nanoarchaeota archaeon]
MGNPIKLEEALDLWELNSNLKYYPVILCDKGSVIDKRLSREPIKDGHRYDVKKRIYPEE